jgi:hypothetical protein
VRPLGFALTCAFIKWGASRFRSMRLRWVMDWRANAIILHSIFFGLKWVVWFATAYFSFVWQKIFSFICLNLPVHENDFLSCGNQIQNSILSCHIFHLRIERVRLQPLWPSPTILHMFKVTLAILFCFALSHTFLA